MRHYIRGLTGLVTLAPLLVLVSGCGADAPVLEVHPVKGVVHYKGQPMKGGGSILFLPVEEGGKEASGTIEKDGTFTLKTYQPGDGAAAGHYRVAVYQTTSVEPEPVPDGQPAPEVEESVPVQDHIPAIFSNPARSPLSQEVKAGENNFTIELQTDTQRGA